MQLLPETGQGIADRTGGNEWKPEDLLNPELNIRYGSWYLRHLLDKYERRGARARRVQRRPDERRPLAGGGSRDPVRRDAPLRRARAGAEGDLRRRLCRRARPVLSFRACASSLALLLALVVAVPALAVEPEPYLRNCSSSAYGDLGRGWQRACGRGRPACVRRDQERPRVQPVPQKVLVVVEPNRIATVTIAARSRLTSCARLQRHPPHGQRQDAAHERHERRALRGVPCGGVACRPGTGARSSPATSSSTDRAACTSRSAPAAS